MKFPTISIVTCSYGQGRFIDATIRSVLNQNYPALEYLVIDGASKDNTVEVIRRHEPQLAYWVSEPDKGQSDALLKGFARATGEVQGWLCSDDLLLPGALQRVGEVFARNPEVDFVFGDALWIDENGKLLRPKKEMGWNRFVYLFDHNYLAQPSCFWRRSLFERAGGLDTSLHLAMDADLWLRFARFTRPRHIPAFLSCMRFYPQQKTQALKPAGRNEGQALFRREAPAWMQSLPQPPMRAAARTIRMASKLMKGCYTASVPPHMHAWLEQHAIR